MFKPTSHKRILFMRGSKLLALGLISFVTILSVLTMSHQKATAASSNLNFQARLMASSGAIVPDGNYNVEFKIYNTLTSTGSSQGSCTGDAACLWTETRTSANQVRVVNGYLTVNLGSVTALPNINWSQDLWLTMNIGGTGASPTWDGEMSPRLQLTAVPYAFSASQLSTTSGANSSTLGFATPTATNNILLPDASGTVCLQSSAACGFALSSGSGGYIQNRTSVQPANFNVQASSSGSVAGTLQANAAGTGDILDLKDGSGLTVGSVSSVGALLFQNSTNSTSALTVKNAAGTSTVLNVDTTNGRVGVGGVALASKFEVQGGDAAIYNNGGNPRLILGNSTSDYGYLQWDSTNHYFRIETVGTNGLKINDNNVTIGNIYPSQPLTVAQGTTQLFQVTSTGTVLSQTSTNSTTGFQVQNSSSAPVLDVDTSNSRVGIGTNTPSRTADIAINNSTANSLPLLLEQGGTGDVGMELKLASQSYYVGADATDGNFKISSNTATGTSTVMGYNTIGTSTDSSDQNSMNATKFTASATGTVSQLNAYISTVDASPNNKGQMAIYSDSSGSPGSLLSSSSSVTLTGTAWNVFPITPVGVTNGTVYWLVYNTNSSSSSKNNFKMLAAGGTNQSKYVTQTFGTWPSTWSGGVFDNAQASFYGSVSSLTPANDFSASLFTLGNTGQTIFQNSTDSTAAFRIQNAAGSSNLLVADTSNTRIAIGQATAAYTLDVAGDINTTTALRIAGTSICDTVGTTGCVAKSGSGYYIHNQTTVQTANAFLQSASASSITEVLQGATSQTADIFDVENSSNAILLGVSAAGKTSLQNSTVNAAVLVLNNTDGTTGVEFRSGGSGLNNIFIGNNTGSSATTGDKNTGVGTQALKANADGSNNSAFGYFSLNSNTSGNKNTAVGYYSLQANTTGANNTGIGYYAFQGNTGSNNTALGYYAGYQDPATGTFQSGTALTNSTALGYGSQVQASNTLTLGGQGTNAVKVGIGTTIPSNTLSVSPVQYSTGTASQSATTVTGVGTTWTAAMVGDELIFANGVKETITGFTSTTVLTASVSQTVTSQAYRLHYVGFQVTSGGLVGIGTSTPAYTLDVAGDINTSTTLKVAGVTMCDSTGCTAKTGSGYYIHNGTSVQSANFNVQAAASGSVAATLQANAAGTGDILDLKNGSGTNVATFGSTGAIVLQNSTDSINALRVTTSIGGTNEDVLRVDTASERVAIGVISGTPSSKLNIATGSAVGLRVYENGAFDVLQLANGTGDILNINQGGSTLHKTLTNSTSGFQVQNASSNTLFNIDTTNNTTSIQAAATQTADIFRVKDSSSNLLVTVAQTGQIVLGNGGNTVTFASSTFEPTLAGNARHQKSIVLTPEYAGAVLDAANDATCTSANSGTMTSALDLTNRTNYYKWTTVSGTNQCYDVVVQMQVPSDWAAWNGAPTVATYTSDTTNGTLKLEIRDTTGSVETNDNFASVTPTSTTTWQTKTGGTLGGTYTAGSVMILRIRMTSPTGGDVRLGNIALNYYSKY